MASMLSWVSGRSNAAAAPEPKPAVLLVLQADDYDWPSIFKDARLEDGRKIQVVQTGWKEIHVHADTYSSSGLRVEVRSLAKSAKAQDKPEDSRNLNISPDFVLVRNECKTPDFDGKGLLNGFLFYDVPTVNSLESILMNCERPAMQGQLHRISRRLGAQAFPVMDQHFASSHRSFMYGYTFPAVVKVGSAHAGVGKMLIQDHHQMSDFRSVLAMMPSETCIAEPFIKGAKDLRIQKIGGHYRAFERRDISGEWKTNTGTALMEEVEVQDRWRRWADACSEMFGGMDILAVDAIVEEDTDREYILEVNGTSIGLHPDAAEEDNRHIRDLVLQRMNAALCVPEEPPEL